MDETVSNDVIIFVSISDDVCEHHIALEKMVSYGLCLASARTRNWVVGMGQSLLLTED